MRESTLFCIVVKLSLFDQSCCGLFYMFHCEKGPWRPVYVLFSQPFRISRLYQVSRPQCKRVEQPSSLTRGIRVGRENCGAWFERGFFRKATCEWRKGNAEFCLAWDRREVGFVGDVYAVCNLFDACQVH